MGKRRKKTVVQAIVSDSSSNVQASRPERLMLRRSVPSGEEGGPRLIVVRQPRGPSEVPFSKLARVPRPPGHLPILTAE